MNLGVLGERHALAREHRVAHVLDYLRPQIIVRYLFGMLRGYDHLLHVHGASVRITHRNLSLAVRAQMRHAAVFAHFCQTLRQAMGQIHRHGHERCLLYTSRCV